ncbi:hypothetical protein [Beijerinckia mobilis]|uniref:hypothetical protein n=1 Tax=Beijerinckia mobilis TaxID=231434 RepID=UPI00054D633F|nr:hypothetical protein [Beijerinckia mobilis]
MKLAADEITITINYETIYLKPTLRAAIRLERKHGFQKILTGLQEGSITIISDIIAESTVYKTALPAFLDEIGELPLGATLDLIVPALFAHVLRLAGLDEFEPEEARQDEKSKVERITYAERHEKLFQIATGWLGWTPEVALNATVPEIEAAYKGRIDMLKAIFASNDAENKQEEARKDLSLDEKVRLAFGNYKIRKVTA